MIGDDGFVGSVAVDIDGTICEPIEWERWQKDGLNYFPPVQAGAKEAIEELRKLGLFIIIHSCRTTPLVNNFAYSEGQMIALVAGMLHKEKIPYDLIWSEVGKPIADLYIDDKGVYHAGSWADTMKEVKRRLVG